MKKEQAILKMARELSGTVNGTDLEMHCTPHARHLWLASVPYKARRARNRWAFGYGDMPDSALIALFQELVAKGATPPDDLRWMLPDSR